jgi:general secretion pathway protein D
VEGTGGQRQPVIGTRRIESTIRLKDGETNFLAGLIRTEDIEGESGIPGLSDIPLIGRLFSNHNRDHTRTDVVMTMTPHIIRTPNLTESDLLPIWVGTESNITFRGGSPRVESDVEGPFEQPDQRERVQQLLRERLQRLPRGLRGEDGSADEEQEPGGTNLAPSSAPPSSLFERDDEDDPENRSDLSIPPYLLRPGNDSGSLLGAAAALALAASSEEADVTVSLVPRRLVAAVGETVTVDVRAETDVPVAHFPLNLRYDPNRLRVERVTAGDFLGRDGARIVLADPSRPGEITLGASRLGQNGGVAGEGVVAQVEFRVLEAGEAVLTFDAARAKDASLAPLPVATESATLRLMPGRETAEGPRQRLP